MIRVMLAAILMITATVAASVEAANQPVQTSQKQFYNPDADAGADIARLRVILSMLRQSWLSLKDIDELAQIGMPESEIHIMREALLNKIDAMKMDALQTIQDL